MASAADMNSSLPLAPRPQTVVWRTLVFVSLLGIAGGIGYTFRVWIAHRDLRQARADAQWHRVDQAVSAYRRHLAHFPQDGAVRLELASLIKHRDPGEALAEYRAMPLASPEMPLAARQVAAICLELGRDYDALGPLLYLQEKLPDDAGVQLALAEIRFRERNFEAALSHARRCRALQPSLPGAYLIAAESLDELKRSGEMVEPLEAVLKLDSELSAAHLNLAYAYQTLGRFDDAFKQIQWYLQRDAKTASAERILALIEQGRGHLPEALAAARKALKLQPHDLEAGLLEADLLLSLNQAETAFQHATVLAEYYGDEERLLKLRIRTAKQTGRTAEAEKLQSRLTRLTASGK